MRGEWKNKRDGDILVAFEEPISLLEFVAIERHLSKLTGVKNRPGYENRIKTEAAYPEGGDI